MPLGTYQNSTTKNFDDVVRKFGHINIPLASTTYPVWSAAQSLNLITTAEKLNITSTSNNDIVGGTGLRRLFITGVGEDYRPQYEEVNMNGIPGVQTQLTWMGVNRLGIVQGGSTRVNAGTINATGSSSGFLAGQVAIGKSFTQQGFYYIPRGRTFELTQAFFNIYQAAGTTPRVTVSIIVVSLDGSAQAEIFQGGIDAGTSNVISIGSETVKAPVPQKLVIIPRVSSNTTNCQVSYNMYGELV